MSALTDELRAIRKIYDIWAVLGVEPRRDNIVCPLPMHAHHSNTPSFGVFFDRHGVQRFRCLGNCGKTGDVIDLAGYLYLPNYNDKNPEHIRQAIACLGHKPISMPEPQPQKPPLPFNKWREYLPPRQEVLAYAHTRGLSQHTLEHFKVGQYRNFMAIPAFEGGLLKTIKFRNTLPKEQCDGRDFDHLRFWAARGGAKALFNYDEVAWSSDPILLLKGEIPAMLAWQYGLKACAPTAGEGSFINEYILPLSLARKIVVVGDNDEDPQTREKMQAAAVTRAAALHGAAVFPPQEFQDWDKWLLARKDECLEVTRSWLA